MTDRQNVMRDTQSVTDELTEYSEYLGTTEGGDSAYADVSMSENQFPAEVSENAENTASRHEIPTVQSSELSGTYARTDGEFKNTPVQSPMTRDESEVAGPSFAEPQTQEGNSCPAPGSELYISEIPNRLPAPEYLHDEFKRQSGIHHLRTIIEAIDLEVPGSMDHFVGRANAGLDFLAAVGINPRALRDLEDTCREVEYHIRQIRSSNLYPEGISLSYLQKVIERYKRSLDIAHDELIKSGVAIDGIEESSATLMTELEKNKAEEEDLQSRIAQLRARREKIHNELAVQDQMAAQAQQRREICQQVVADTEAALKRTTERWQAADEEFKTLVESVQQMDALQQHLLRD